MWVQFSHVTVAPDHVITLRARQCQGYRVSDGKFDTFHLWRSSGHFSILDLDVDLMRINAT